MLNDAGDTRHGDHTLTRRVGWALAIVACLAIAYGTLTPRPGMSGREGYAAICRICDGTPGVDIIANVVLFVPLGVALILAGMRPVRALLLMGAMTTAIELVQIPLPGRDASPVDIATNLTGAAIGVLIGRHWRTLLMPNARAAARLALGAGIAFLAVITATSVALTPSLNALPWEAIRFAGSDLGPSGRVLDIRVAGEAIVDAYVRKSPEDRAGLLAGEPVVVRAVISQDPSQSTHLAQIVNREIDDIVVISRVRDRATFHIRNRGRDARLREIGVRLTGMFSGSGTDTVDVTGRWERGSLVITGQRGSDVREYRLPLTASLGWAFLLPVSGGVGAAFMPLNAAWLAFMLLPFAYWGAAAARASARPAVWRGLQALVIVAAMLGPSAILPVAPPSWWEWVTALATVAVVELAVGSIVRRTHVNPDRSRDGLEPART